MSEIKYLDPEQANSIPGIKQQFRFVKKALEDGQTIPDIDQIRANAAKGATAYQKPSGGIPASDLNSTVRNALSKAEGAISVPGEPGTVGQVLQLDAQGNPAWVTPSAGTTPDSEMSKSSTNAVQNKVITEELLLGTVYDVSAKNPTAGPNNDGKWGTLSALLSDTNLNTLIPTAVRKGGMSVKYVQSSDNKYVQYRLMADTFSTIPSDWQGVDDEPIDDSNNLITSGSVFTKNKEQFKVIGKNIIDSAKRLGEIAQKSETFTTHSNWVTGGYYNTEGIYIPNDSFKTMEISVTPEKIYSILCNNGSWTDTIAIALFDENNNFLNGVQTTSYNTIDFVFCGVYKIIISTGISNTVVSIKSYDNTLSVSEMLSDLQSFKTLYTNWNGIPLKNIQDITIEGNLLYNSKLIKDAACIGGINTDGTLVFNTSSTAAPFKTYLLPVDGVSTYLFTHIRFAVLMQDETHAISGATLLQNQTSMSSVGANYIAFSFNASRYPISTYQIGIGSLQQTPIYRIPYLKVENSNIEDNSISGTKLLNESISINKVGFVKLGKNLFNVNDSDIVLNSYLSNNTITSGGSVAPLYNVTGYIKVEPNTTYQCSNDGDVIHDTYLGRFICQYDEDKGYLSGIDITALLDTQQFTTGPNTHFVRISVRHPYWDKYQVEKGTVATAWEAFGYYFGIEYLPTGDIATKVFQPNQGFSKYSGAKTLAQNETLNLPQSYIRKNIAFTALISGANSANLDILVGLGYNKYDGGWLELTPDKIIVHKYESSDTTTEYTHGLTLAEDVVINFDAGTTDAVIRIISDGRIFSQQIDRGFYFAGAGFVTNKGNDEISAALVVMPKDIAKKIWLFGDSYLGWINPQRWPYWMLEWGFDAWLGDARPGGNSTEGLVSFYNDVKIGKPVYLIWANGMNDTGDTNADTPDSTWLANEQSVINKCESIGVVPVLATIPSVPSKIHDGKNKWIRESRYRYIDFAAAVGATSAGVWKAGMLSGDNIHPTELGAKALASQALIDFPEIMVMN